MGRRTGQGTPPTQPIPRKKPKTLLGVMIRAVAIVAIALVVFFAVAGFYFSGSLENGALKPPTGEPPTYSLEVVDTSATTISVQGPESDDQLGRVGVEGIEWADGYVQSPGIGSSTKVGDTRIEIRDIDPDGTAPAVGTLVGFDPFAYDGNPLDALGIEYEDVVYPSDIGSFPAWFIPGTSDTWAIIVHGKGASREEGLRLIPLLKDLGYPILVISYRNDIAEVRDPSGYHQYGKTEWVDVAAAVTYAEENGAVDHVLFGYSMGGGIVTSFLAQSPLRNRTKAAILDSPVLSFERTVDFQASRTTLPLLPITVPGPVTQFAKWISAWRFDIDWAATDYLSQTANLHAPMLIFHGTNDTSVPYATSAEMAESRPDIVTLVTTRATHTRSWNMDPEAYEKAVREFLAGLD
ncbi:MAG: alpha/beta hydrolase [Actinomycetia bacterium]|nr:alpha/beta hydrolase [Actinomycetes bacterium]